MIPQVPLFEVRFTFFVLCIRHFVISVFAIPNSFAQLLRKFTWTDSISTDHAHASAGSGAAGTGDAAGALTRKRYCLDALPQYLILHLVR